MTSFPAYSRTTVILSRSASRIPTYTAIGSYALLEDRQRLRHYYPSPSFNHLRCQGHSSVPPPHIMSRDRHRARSCNLHLSNPDEVVHNARKKRQSPAGQTPPAKTLDGHH
ncbi:hypothetical protein MHYP_G00108710 [Metynnis hypsauchen]